LTRETASDADIELARSLSKLWPHRVHESSVWKNLLCTFHLHRWAQLNLSSQAPGRNVRFCRWCERIAIDGKSFG
jgi:hypothetical protein